MPLCALPDRTVIEVAGNDALHFLQNLVTANLETLGLGVVTACALLTPQGKVMFDFLMSKKAEDAFWLDIRSDMTENFIKRLTLYKLRASVDITVLDQVVITTSWDRESAASHFDSLTDRRFAGVDVQRHYGDSNLPSGDGDFDALRIAHGVVESGADYALGDAFGHDISLDQNGGVDFRKGCYVGQEVVSRMHHRKTARRRVVIVEGASLSTGATVLAGGKPAGEIGTVRSNKALAIVRLDRIKDAVEVGKLVTVNDASVRVELPAGVSYGWPTSEAGDA